MTAVHLWEIRGCFLGLTDDDAGCNSLTPVEDIDLKIMILSEAKVYERS